MAICPSCGEENPDRFRLCGFCGTPLVAASAPREMRKLVTVVFSDLEGSTTLGDTLDSEVVREVLARYFEEMRIVLEAHGGTVEKYIGDAIMAVFGLPATHEDDALRAVRAAADMQTALEALNEELHRRWGVRLTHRTGVNTGEVVAGDTGGQALRPGTSSTSPPGSSRLRHRWGSSSVNRRTDSCETPPRSSRSGSWSSRASPSPCPPTAYSPCGRKATTAAPTADLWSDASSS